MKIHCCRAYLLLLFLTACTDVHDSFATGDSNFASTIENVKGISLPAGFHYVKASDSLYAGWLLDLKIKKSKTVYLYNGTKKEYQGAQFAVLDMDIGKKDLVQCADAAIKLRADFLFKQKRFSEIKFTVTSGDELSFEQWTKGRRWKVQRGKLVSFTTTTTYSDIRSDYASFMEMVYSYCGTFSLSKQLKEVREIEAIQPGDLFIQGGFPGHTVTVIAVAENNAGEKIFLLSQGYMPAQDIHVLKNNGNTELSPWYDITEMYPLHTPQWQFESGSLKRW